MFAFCTYCSRDKTETSGSIPAIERYLGARIQSVYAASASLGVDFYILSGEFGLLPPQQPIPWYDHRLEPEEVGPLVDRLCGQLASFGISGLVYFTRSFTEDPGARPYYDALIEACRRMGRPFLKIELGLQD